MNFDLHKIKPNTFVLIILMAISILCPGTLFIYIFNKELFLKIETLKLLILCFSFTLPIWFFNVGIVERIISLSIEYEESIAKKDEEELSDIEEEKETIERLHIQGSLGSIVSIPVIYIPILIKIFSKISLHTGIIISICVQFIIILIYIILLRIIYKRIKKNKLRNQKVK